MCLKNSEFPILFSMLGAYMKHETYHITCLLVNVLMTSLMFTVYYTFTHHFIQLMIFLYYITYSVTVPTDLTNPWPRHVVAFLSTSFSVTFNVCFWRPNGCNFHEWIPNLNDPNFKNIFILLVGRFVFAFAIYKISITVLFRYYTCSCFLCFNLSKLFTQIE